MKYFSFIIILLMTLLVGCGDNNLASDSSDIGEVEEVSNENIDEPKGIPMGVSGDLVRAFIKDSEFFGLQQMKPDNMFFVHLAAPGYSIQLEGESPDEMTGAMIDISYEGNNFGMGRGNIAHLLQILLDNERGLETNKWVTDQFVAAEISVKSGIKPQESRLEIDNLAVIFFPPTSVDNLSATILMYATDRITSKGNSENTITNENNTDSISVGQGYNSENASGKPEGINATNEYGVTKLAKASSAGDVNLVKELLRQGADPNLYKGMGEPPLLWAVRSNQDNVVKILLDAGADPNFKSKEGVTPLIIAKENGANVILKYLEEYGAKE